MPEMKDSGIEFIGDIPADWEVLRVKNIGSYRNGLTYSPSDLCDPEDGTLVLRSSNIRNGKLIFDDNVYVSSPIPSELCLKENDILICSRNGSQKLVGKSAIINNVTASFGAFMMVFRCNELCEPKYAYYIFNSDVFGYYLGTFFTSTINQLTGANFGNMSIPFCSNKGIQKQIADFLDLKCAEIDALIADIQSEIETLEEYKKSVITEAVTKGLNPDVPMKDSSVQWIGMMPEHWECIKGKYVLKYLQKPVREDDGVITCFRDGEVTLRSNRREDGFTMSDKEIGYQGIDVGDLVVHGMDGFAGSIGISDSRGKASPVLNVLDTDMDKKYVMYYLRSMAYSDVFLALATGIRVRSCDLRWNKLAELLYPVPPLDEQIKISAHIDDTLEEANAVIAIKKKQLETLEEYKKSVIYEYVTGKKEVV